MKVDLAIGASLGAVTMAIPDELLTIAGKLTFAVLTAAVAAVVSHIVGKWLKARDARTAAREAKAAAVVAKAADVVTTAALAAATVVATAVAAAEHKDPSR